MATSRTTGLILICLGAFTFFATTQQLIPAITFFPGVVVCALGLVVFMKANRVAMKASEERLHKRLHPEIKNAQGDKLAKSQASIVGTRLDGLGSRDGRVAAGPVAAAVAPRDEVVLDAGETGAADDSIPGLESELAPDEIDPETAARANAAAQSEDDVDPGFVVTTDVSFPDEEQESGSLAEQLTKLQRLANDGIITAEEFAVAKAKILS